MGIEIVAQCHPLALQSLASLIGSVTSLPIANDRDLQFFSNPHQVCERLCLHFAHDLATMDLQGDLTDTELGGRRLVQKAADHELQHLALPRRKSRQAPAELGPLGPCRSLLA